MPASFSSDDETSQRDTELMLRLRNQRDEEALRELITRYQRPVFALAYRMLHNTSEAEDITQRTFIRVWQASTSYEPSAKFTTWLFTIVRNLVFNETRRRLRKPTTSLDACMQQGIEDADTHTTPPDIDLEHKEIEQAVDAALAQLSPHARMAIQLRRFEEMSYEQIADILGTTLPATKSLLFRARQELRRILQQYL